MESEDCCCDKKLLKANELPIYESREDSLEYEVVQRPSSVLQQGISHVRRNLTGPFESLQGVKEQVGDIYDIALAHTKTSYEYITDDANMIPRAAAITVGGLSGLLLGTRGGIFKKVFYSGTGMFLVASICYPKQVFEYSKYGYQWTKDKSSTLIKDTTGYDFKNTSWNVTEKIPYKDSFEKLSEQVKGVFTAKKTGDDGQSNPEDRDMYTTRSK